MVKIKLPMHFLNEASYDDILLRKWAYTLLPDKKFYNILDANCLNGKNIETLLNKYPSAKIAGISDKEEDVANTIRLNKTSVENHRSEFCKVKLNNLPYRDNVFDLVMLFSKEPDSGELKELNRVMKENACLIVAGKTDLIEMSVFLNSLKENGFTSFSLAEEEEFGRFAILAYKV